MPTDKTYLRYGAHQITIICSFTHHRLMQRYDSYWLIGDETKLFA